MGVFWGLEDKNKDLHSLHRVLFETYKYRVYKTAYFIMKNEDDAKDIVQDAFITAFSKLEQLREKDKFGSWICTIACNLAKDKYNKKKKEICMEDEEQIFLQGREYVSLNLPEEILEKKELNAHIREQIQGLKHHYSEILYLYYYCDMSYEEISIALNLNLGTVKTRLFRAKKLLKDSLKLVQEERESCYE
ncbi:MAG: sigma-70 family RNA polymerase sigma factor [Thermotaleaceae bacterium]